MSNTLSVLVCGIFPLWKKINKCKVELTETQEKMRNLLLHQKILLEALHEDEKKNHSSNEPKTQAMAKSAQKIMDKFREIQNLFEEWEKIEEAFKSKLKNN